MKAKPSKEKRGVEARVPQSTADAELLALWKAQVKHTPEQWRRESVRLKMLHKRTGNDRDLKAFQIYCAGATIDRLRELEALL